MISINEVRKGSRVELRNGFLANVLDNQTKAQTRMCEVEGFVTEMGSVYTTDMLTVMTPHGWMPIEHTPKQIAGRELRQSGGW
jgi:hypothetical protein